MTSWEIAKTRGRYKDIKGEYDDDPADAFATLGVLAEDMGKALMDHVKEDNERHKEVVELIDAYIQASKLEHKDMEAVLNALKKSHANLRRAHDKHVDAPAPEGHPKTMAVNGGGNRLVSTVMENKLVTVLSSVLVAGVLALVSMLG